MGEAQEDIVKTPTTGVYNFVVPVSATLRVQLYGNQGDDVCEQLNVLAGGWKQTPLQTNALQTKLAFYNAESVQDLTEVYGTIGGCSCIHRFFVRTTSEILDDLSVIEQVEVDENIKIDETDILHRQYTIAIRIEWR